MKTKKCTKCGIHKPIEDYYKYWQYNKQYTRSICRTCMNIKSKQDYKDKFYTTQPECECGGKVVTSPKESRSGVNYQQLVWMCCSCGSTLGYYKEPELTPERMMEIQSRKGIMDWEQLTNTESIFRG